MVDQFLTQFFRVFEKAGNFFLKKTLYNEIPYIKNKNCRQLRKPIFHDDFELERVPLFIIPNFFYFIHFCLIQFF